MLHHADEGNRPQCRSGSGPATTSPRDRFTLTSRGSTMFVCTGCSASMLSKVTYSCSTIESSIKRSDVDFTAGSLRSGPPSFVPVEQTNLSIFSSSFVRLLWRQARTNRARASTVVQRTFPWNAGTMEQKWNVSAPWSICLVDLLRTSSALALFFSTFLSDSFAANTDSEPRASPPANTRRFQLLHCDFFFGCHIKSCFCLSLSAQLSKEGVSDFSAPLGFVLSILFCSYSWNWKGCERSEQRGIVWNPIKSWV